MGAVFWLSVRQSTGRWRLALVFFPAALPVGLATLVSLFADKGTEYEEGFTNVLLDGLTVGGILPIITMAFSTSAFGNELEDRTLSYLVLKPIPRWQIVLPKLLASVAISGPLLIVSGVVATVVGLDSGPRAAVAVGLALFAGVAAYAAIFTWAGLVTTRALPFALIYVFLWEGLIGSFINGVGYLSVRGYTLAIMHGIDEPGFQVLSSRVIEFPVALVGAAVVTVVFFWLGVRRLRRMDVPYAHRRR
jgi:ABC-2 type transport system permease protein